MVDVSKSFELEEGGLTLNGVWFGAGDFVPSFDAPIGSEFTHHNGTKYKQDGPALSNWQVQASSTVTDHHAGYNLVESGKIVIISAGKNMISHGISVEGELCLDGYLVIGV